MNKGIYVLLLSVICVVKSISQNTLPDKNVLLNQKVFKIIVDKYKVLNDKEIKASCDTLSFDTAENLVLRKITKYDSIPGQEFTENYTYTYDRYGNRVLETSKAPKIHIMDYFNYVYDSSHVEKKIWTYWFNLRHVFDRIYEYRYDAEGKLKIEIIEGGSEQVDSVLSFKYDVNKRLSALTYTSDSTFKDTLYSISYLYNLDGSLSEKITLGKGIASTEKYSYDQNKSLVEKISGRDTLTYQYNPKGLLTEENEGTIKYTYKYIYR